MELLTKQITFECEGTLELDECIFLNNHSVEI